VGQYHCVLNLDKHEKLVPHYFGDGLKLMEFGCSGDGTMTALAILLAGSVKGGSRGGGDFGYTGTMADVLVGRWAGDRIAIVGDYCEDNDVPGFTKDDLQYATENNVDISKFMWDLLSADGVSVRAPFGGARQSLIFYDKERDIFVDPSAMKQDGGQR